MEIYIEAKRGQYRKRKDGSMKRYAADYGEIIGTKGADGDPIDVFRGIFPDTEQAYIVNQYKDGRFDEHKVMADFYDREQAEEAYRITYGKKPSEIFTVSRYQLSWWLKYGNHKKPVTAQSFPFDSESKEMTEQTNLNWTNESQTAAKLIYGWRNADEHEELLEAATMDDVIDTEIENGAEFAEEAAFDALVVENRKLERTAQILGKSLNKASSTLQVAENGVQISKPMKQNGTTNIAVMYEITDGQTVTVMFHNPDTTPQKIAPDDMLISWKWLLNRKDITIVVAKENGKDLPVQTVARRVMALVEKNTARFAKANANRAARLENIKNLEAEVETKRARLEELVKQIEAAKNGDIAPSNTAPSEEAKPQTEQPSDGITYAVWGKASGSQYEELIADKVPLDDGEIVPIDTLKFAEFIKNDAEKKGYTEVRISAVNMGVKPDFAKAAGDAGNILTEPLDESKLAPLSVPENATAKEVRKALEDYLKQLQGKTVITSDGKTVRFSKQSKGHLAQDSAYDGKLIPQAVAHVADVLKTGDFIERQGLSKERNDKYIAFHVYRKWVNVEDIDMLLQVKAAELDSGVLEAGEGLIAYTAKTLDEKRDASRTATLDSVPTDESLSPSNISYENHTAVFDAASSDEPYIFIEILEVRQKGGDVSSETPKLFNYGIQRQRFGGRVSLTSAYIRPLPGKQFADAEIQEMVRLLKESGNFGSVRIEGSAIYVSADSDKIGNVDDLPDLIEDALPKPKIKAQIKAEKDAADREAAFDYLSSLADKGETVFCRALNADVGFSKSGAKKYKQLSANPVKSQMAAHIKQIIANGQKFKESQENYTGNGQQKYHYLKTSVAVEGNEYTARVVIREDGNGHFHYDLQVKDAAGSVMDSVNAQSDKVSSVNKSDVPYRFGAGFDSANFDDTAAFDSASSGFVLNLFVTDADGNPIEDDMPSENQSDKLPRLEKIKLHWSENSSDRNIEFANLDELQAWFLRTYNEQELRPEGGGYYKNKLGFFIRQKDGGIEEKTWRVDVSPSDGDFNPFAQHIGAYEADYFEKHGIAFEYGVIKPETTTKMPSESPKQPGQESDMVEKARQFAQDLVDGKYTTQDMIDGVMDDKLDWLIHLDGVDNDLLDKAFAAYADLA